ncbi:hypothetical protein [Rossellomorea sp. LjRoot5]|uniref:hypothetical protein n=1 Tax=Rossellomorea sp. LjRoot5 TaxID=3342331 RepID=UPI003ECFD190
MPFLFDRLVIEQLSFIDQVEVRVLSEVFRSDQRRQLLPQFDPGNTSPIFFHIIRYYFDFM